MPRKTFGNRCPLRLKSLLKKIDCYLLSLWWGTVVLVLGCGFLPAQRNQAEVAANLPVAPMLNRNKIGAFSGERNPPLSVGLLADTSLIKRRMIDQG